MAKELEFEFVDTKKKFLNVFLSKPMKDWYIQQRNGNNNLAKKIAYINKLRAAFGAWRRLVAYRRLMNESDNDSDMPSLVDSSDMSSDSHPDSDPDEYESDSDSDPAFDGFMDRHRKDVCVLIKTTTVRLLEDPVLVRLPSPHSTRIAIKCRIVPVTCGSEDAADEIEVWNIHGPTPGGNVSQVTADGGNVVQLAANLHMLAPVNGHTSSSTGSRAGSTPLTDRPKGRLSVILECIDEDIYPRHPDHVNMHELRYCADLSAISTHYQSDAFQLAQCLATAATLLILL